jgi:hypothetical protein
MIQVSLNTGDLQRVTGLVETLTERNIAFAVARAMNGAAAHAQQQLKAELVRSIDRPTRWTLGGTFRTYAKAQKPEVIVGMRSDPQPTGNPAGRYLRPMVYGTRPRLKGADLSAQTIAKAPRSAVLIPARSAGLIDGYGNVPLRRQSQILAGLRSGRGYYVAPVKRGSSTLAIFEASESFLGRTSTLVKRRRRLFTLDASPAPRRPDLPLHRTLSDAFAARWPTELRSSLQQELQRRLGR